MYRSLHGMTPEYLRSRFVYRNEITPYRLRSTENKYIGSSVAPRQLYYLKKSFSYSGARLWNGLSSDLRAAIFKLNIRHHSFESVLTRHPGKAAFSMYFRLVRDN